MNDESRRTSDRSILHNLHYFNLVEVVACSIAAEVQLLADCNSLFQLCKLPTLAEGNVKRSLVSEQKLVEKCYIQDRQQFFLSIPHSNNIAPEKICVLTTVLHWYSVLTAYTGQGRSTNTQDQRIVSLSILHHQYHWVIVKSHLAGTCTSLAVNENSLVTNRMPLVILNESHTRVNQWTK